MPHDHLLADNIIDHLRILTEARGATHGHFTHHNNQLMRAIDEHVRDWNHCVLIRPPVNDRGRPEMVEDVEVSFHAAEVDHTQYRTGPDGRAEAYKVDYFWLTLNVDFNIKSYDEVVEIRRQEKLKVPVALALNFTQAAFDDWVGATRSLRAQDQYLQDARTVNEILARRPEWVAQIIVPAPPT